MHVQDIEILFTSHNRAMLPDDVTSAPSLSIFRRHLKTHLFRCCYSTLWFCCTYSDYSGPHGGVAA